MNIRNYSLEQIKALIVEGTDVLVITSPASSDKNALSGQMESIRDPYWRTSLILADANTNIESLSHEIIQQALPDQFNDNLPAVSQVHKYLEYSALNGILPVIIVDDAHAEAPAAGGEAKEEKKEKKADDGKSEEQAMEGLSSLFG